MSNIFLRGVPPIISILVKPKEKKLGHVIQLWLDSSDCLNPVEPIYRGVPQLSTSRRLHLSAACPPVVSMSSPMIDVVDVVALVIACFAVLTLPVYISLSRLLIVERSKNFTGSFYDLFLVVSFLDITSIVCNFIGVSLPGWGVTTVFAREYSSVYGKIYLTVQWFCRVNQGLSSALIAVNRGYAMVIPLKYAKIWRKSLVRRLQLFQVIPGLLFAVVILFFDISYLDSHEYILRRMTFRIVSDGQRSLLYKAAGAIEIFLIAIILIAYGTGITALISKESKRPAHDYSISQKKSRAERSATFMGISICCLEVVYFIYSAFAVFFTIPANTYFSIHSSMTDLYSFLNCYFLLAFSQSVRRRLFKVCYSNQQIEPSTTLPPGLSSPASARMSQISRIE